MESILGAWERLQEYMSAYPHHGMDEWLVLQSFYNGLTMTSQAHIDAAAGVAFLDMTITKAKSFGRENGLQSGVERRTTPTPDKGHAYHQGDGYDCCKAGPPDQENGRREPTIDQGSRLRHGFALHVRSLWQRWTLGE